MADEDQNWGRVLITGGIDFFNNETDYPRHGPNQDLVEPHSPRALCHVRITKVLSSHVARYTIALDAHGSAWIIGRHFTPAYASRPPNVARLDEPARVAPPSGRRLVGGAVSRLRAYLLDDAGGVWGCGDNVFGTLGALVPEFRRVDGSNFVLFLDDAGRVYGAGCGEYGALGNGKTGEYLLRGGKTTFESVTTPTLAVDLQDQKIVAVATGLYHSLALDGDGRVWSWGRGDAGQLGLRDRSDRLRPVPVTQFGPGQIVARQIACGHTSSVVIDADGKCWITGTWRRRGVGAAETPLTEFGPYPGYARVLSAHIGFCGHFFVVDKDGKRSVLAVGEACIFGSLGLGKKGRVSSSPTPVPALSKLHVLDIAPSLWFTLVLVRPDGTAYDDVPRYPDKLPSAKACLACVRAQGALLECQKCDAPYHPACLDPPIAWPAGEWFCPPCAADGDASPATDAGAVTLACSFPQGNTGRATGRRRAQAAEQAEQAGQAERGERGERGEQAHATAAGGSGGGGAGDGMDVDRPADDGEDTLESIDGGEWASRTGGTAGAGAGAGATGGAGWTGWANAAGSPSTRGRGRGGAAHGRGGRGKRGRGRGR